MQLLPNPEQGRFLALVLLLIAVLAGYYLCVHWWFTAPHLDIASQIAELKEQERGFRETVARRPLLEKQLAQVDRYEQGNPAFLPEADFDAAAAGLIQRFKQVVASHVTDPARCQILTNTSARNNQPERFERVTLKMRLRCDLEPFAGILYDLENDSPVLFIDDLQIFRQQGYLQPGRNKISTYLDIRLDLYGYIRHRADEGQAAGKKPPRARTRP
ncbi:MAG: type II secretion system protein GspM [Lysobacterales bacterium]